MNFSTVLKIAIIVNFKKKDRGMPITEQHSKIADIIGKGLGLPYEIVPSADNNNGRLLPNGSWTGMAGMVHRGEADLAAFFEITEERFQSFSFGYPFSATPISFITHKPHLLSPTYTYLHPFKIEVWISVLLATIIMATIIYIALRGKCKMETIMLNLIGSLLRQSWAINSDSFSKRALQITWLVSSMFITLAYTAVLLSFFTFPPREGIRDIAELSKAVQEGTHQCITYESSDIADNLIKSADQSIRLIGENLKKVSGSNNITKNMENPEKSMIFIAMKKFLNPLKSIYFVPDDNFYMMYKASIYGKHFCCKEKLNDVILRGIECGLFVKVENDAVFTLTTSMLLNHKNEDNESKKPLALSDLWGAFFFLIIVHIIALFIFLLEIISHKFVH